MLEVKNLTVGFPNSSGKILPVIENVNFHINNDETLGIVGESGSGKSLTALSILQLHEFIGAKRISGSVMFENRDLTRLSKKEISDIRGKDISMIFQDPFASFNPLMTIGKHADEVLQAHTKINKKQRREKILELFEIVALPHPHKIYDSFPHEMSGGMLQRIMIAISVSCNPKLLIADEITTALDATIQKKIIQLLKEIQRKYHMPMMFISHDLSLIANVADRVLVMYAGHVVETAPTKDLFEKPHHPYTKGLIHSLPEKNLQSKSLGSIPGNIPHHSQKPIGCPFHPRCEKAKDWCKQEFPPMSVIGDYHESRCIIDIEKKKELDRQKERYIYSQNFSYGAT